MTKSFVYMRSASAAAAARVYGFDPLHDARWEDFVQRHPSSTIFHSGGWLEALRRSYGYKPIVFTTSAPAAHLENAIVMSRIDSRLTGSRLVSVAFADHCQPLVESNDELFALVRHLEDVSHQEHLGYVELRLLKSEATKIESQTGLTKSASYLNHELDLRPALETLFSKLHHSCIRRKICRAQRESLSYEVGRSNALLERFYLLFEVTRRRHGLPPQPLAWFRNLRDCVGEAFKIRMAYKADKPIAGIVTLTYKTTIVYKYGGSDARFHNLGAMPFLFWRTIEEGRALGLCKFDLGRSEHEHRGLIVFKNHLGATPSTLNYYRYPQNTAALAAFSKKIFVPQLCSRMPQWLLTAAGQFLYKHVG